MFKKAKENKKGFTLAELLIVVAIIAVLVAISIPIFTSQLEKSREAVDLANIRSAYAEVMTSAMTGDTTTGVTESSGTYSQDVILTQKKAGWTGDNANAEIGGVNVPAISANTTKVTVSLAKDGTIPTLTPDK